MRVESDDPGEKAPKSGKVRSVPLVPELVGPLDRLSRREHFTDDDELVICSPLGEHVDAWTLRRRYNRALERAGLRRLRFHDLRHCFGSVAVRAFPLSDVQAMLGHAHVTTRRATCTTARARTTRRGSRAPSRARPCLRSCPHGANRG